MRTGVTLTIIGATLVSAVPVILIAVLTWNAIHNITSLPSFFIPLSIAFGAWWAGFFAACHVAFRSIQQRRIPALSFPVIVLGLIACGWLEYESWHDSKQLFPPGFFLIPIGSCLLVGGVARILSNPSFKRDALKRAH